LTDLQLAFVFKNKRSKYMLLATNISSLVPVHAFINFQKV